MAKFCSKCGKPLEDGKPCSCEGTVKTSSTSQKGFGEMLKEYWELVKNVFKKPVTIVEENASEDKFGVALISMGASGAVMGLFLCLLMKKLVGALVSGFGSLSSSIDVPYVKFFLMGFVVMAGTFALMAAIGYFVFGTMFKANTSIKKMFVLVGLTSIIETVALAGCSVLALFELSEVIIYCMAGLVAASSILSIVYFVKGVDKYAKIDADKLGYAVAITYLVTSVAVYLITQNVLPSIMM